MESASCPSSILERMVFPNLFGENRPVLSNQVKATNARSMGIQNTTIPKNETSRNLHVAEKYSEFSLEKMDNSYPGGLSTRGNCSSTLAASDTICKSFDLAENPAIIVESGPPKSSNR